MFSQKDFSLNSAGLPASVAGDGVGVTVSARVSGAGVAVSPATGKRVVEGVLIVASASADSGITIKKISAIKAHPRLIRRWCVCFRLSRTAQDLPRFKHGLLTLYMKKTQLSTIICNNRVMFQV